MKKYQCKENENLIVFDSEDSVLTIGVPDDPCGRPVIALNDMLDALNEFGLIKNKGGEK